MSGETPGTKSRRAARLKSEAKIKSQGGHRRQKSSARIEGQWVHKFHLHTHPLSKQMSSFKSMSSLYLI